MSDDWGETTVKDLSIKENGGEKRESLHELTEGQKNVANNELAKPPVNPQDHGWVTKTTYDYDKFNTPINSKEQNENAPVDDEPLWAGDAKKYEWSEEYGDIGPAIPELEHMLFNSTFMNRRGPKMNL